MDWRKESAVLRADDIRPYAQQVCRGVSIQLWLVGGNGRLGGMIGENDGWEGLEMERDRVAVLAERLLGKLEQAIGELDLQTATRKVKTKEGTTEEVWEYPVTVHRGTVDRAGLKQLTDLLKELQVITGEVSGLERREREARIESLHRSAGLQEVEEAETGVILLPVQDFGSITGG